MELVKSQFSNPKFKNSNPKWFDKPFDHLDKLGIFNRLTVLSKVEGLTTLSSRPKGSQTHGLTAEGLGSKVRGRSNLFLPFWNDERRMQNE
jgi:hypothetical protein